MEIEDTIDALDEIKETLRTSIQNYELQVDIIDRIENLQDDIENEIERIQNNEELEDDMKEEIEDYREDQY